MAKVNPTVVLNVVSVLYKMVLRSLLIKAIEDPDTEWDEFLIDFLDKLFGYEE